MRSASAWLFAFLLFGCTEKARLVSAIEKLSDSPSQFILYSLEPGPLQHDESIQSDKIFHGYDILGHAAITDADEQRSLVRALARGARESDGSSALCFNPRHGLHIEQSGRVVDLVICFECLQVHAHGFQLGDEFVTTASPQSAFDESLRRHQIPLATK